MATVTNFQPTTGDITQQDFEVRATINGVFYSASAILLTVIGGSTVKETPLQFSPSYPSPSVNGQFRRSFPATPLMTDGTQYTYHIVINTGSWVEIHESGQTLTFRQPPMATPVQPSGAGVSTTPTFAGNLTTSPRPVTAIRIQVQRVSDGFTMWDSGFISASGPSFSVAYGGSPLAHSTQFRWRVMARDSGNYLSGWSPFVTFTTLQNTAPVATLIAPTGGAVVGTPTPTLRFAFTDSDTSPIINQFAAYQIQVRKVSDQTEYLDTGWQPTTNEQRDARQVDYVYDGDALESGTEFEWRARVQDNGGAQSDYTAWATFTPALAPNPPSGIEPNGLQNTLTPTIKGTYNQGQGDVEAAFRYQIRQNTVVIYDSGDISGDLATGQVYGTDNPDDNPSTPPALQWGRDYQIRVQSIDDLGVRSDFSPWVSFNTNSAPTTPSNLSPSNAVTGDTTPRLAWRHNDADGDAQTAANIELRDVATDTPVSGYDPKALTQADQFHDVTETLTASPPTAYKWRVQTKGTEGPGFGPFSEWRTFTVAEVPVLTVTAPEQSDVLEAPATLVEWTFSGGSGTQQDWRVVVYASDQTTVVYDTGVVAGEDDSHTIPSGVLSNLNTFYVQVIVRDTLNQQAQSSLIQVTTDWEGPAAIEGFSAVGVGGGDNLPGVYLSWTPTDLTNDEFLRYVIYRRPASNGEEWERVTTIREPSQGAYQDFTVPIGQVFEYAISQFSAIGGEEVESELSNTAQASVDANSLYLFNVLDPTMFVRLPHQTQSPAVTPEVAYLEPWGRESPTAYVGDRIDRTVQVNVRGAWNESEEMLSPELWRGLMALIEAQQSGAVLMARQKRDIAMYCVIADARRMDASVLFDESITLREVHYEEGS